MKVPLQAGCRLLSHHPAGLYAVEKAPGIPSHPNAPGRRETVLMEGDYDFEQEAYLHDGVTWFLLNRLDAPTSGVILLASREEVARAVKAAFARHVVKKEYAALVRGVPPAKRETWRDRLVVRRSGGRLRTQSVPGRPDAETDMVLLQTGKGPPARSLLSLKPRTGRTHQLRVQCAVRRLPVIGDATYGDFAFNREFRAKDGPKRLFLHSWRVGIEVDLAGDRLRFSAESPLPGVFTVALG